MVSDPLFRKAQADSLFERTAMQLKALLVDAAAELDPFPPFPNAFFTNAIEIDPGFAANRDLGCIVVCEDGELYELEIGIDHDSIELLGSWDPVTARKEERKKVDLLPRDYLIYGYAALMALTDELMEQQAGGGT